MDNLLTFKDVFENIYNVIIKVGESKGINTINTIGLLNILKDITLACAEHMIVIVVINYLRQLLLKITNYAFEKSIDLIKYVIKCIYHLLSKIAYYFYESGEYSLKGLYKLFKSFGLLFVYE
tara:strand:+ start:510 stop:875 length:366 start_codon:yes stop_codon:yes gene_type:complete